MLNIYSIPSDLYKLIDNEFCYQFMYELIQHYSIESFELTHSIYDLYAGGEGWIQIFNTICTHKKYRQLKDYRDSLDFINQDKFDDQLEAIIAHYYIKTTRRKQ